MANDDTGGVGGFSQTLQAWWLSVTQFCTACFKQCPCRCSCSCHLTDEGEVNLKRFRDGVTSCCSSVFDREAMHRTLDSCFDVCSGGSNTDNDGDDEWEEDKQGQRNHAYNDTDANIITDVVIYEDAADYEFVQARDEHQPNIPTFQRAAMVGGSDNTDGNTVENAESGDIGVEYSNVAELQRSEDINQEETELKVINVQLNDTNDDGDIDWDENGADEDNEWSEVELYDNDHPHHSNEDTRGNHEESETAIECEDGFEIAVEENELYEVATGYGCDDIAASTASEDVASCSNIYANSQETNRAMTASNEGGHDKERPALPTKPDIKPKPKGKLSNAKSGEALLDRKMLNIIEEVRYTYLIQLKTLQTPWISQQFDIENSDFRVKEFNEKAEAQESSVLLNCTEFLNKAFREKNDNEPVRILLRGEEGIGKSSMSRRIAWDWAHSRLPDVKVVFLLSLSDIKPDDSLETFLAGQFPSLENEMGMLQTLLQNHGRNCLIILDGYHGPTGNAIVENFIRKNKYEMCNLLLVSAPEAGSKVNQYFSTFTQLEGFTIQQAENYLTKSVQIPDQVQNAIEYAKNIDSRDAWKSPFNNSVLSFLFNEGLLGHKKEEQLPLTKLYNKFTFNLLKSTIDKCNCEQKTYDKLHEIIAKISKMALLNLQHRIRLTSPFTEIDEDEIIRKCGLFTFVNPQDDERVFFADRGIQKYLAAKYIVNTIKIGLKTTEDYFGNLESEHYLEIVASESTDSISEELDPHVRNTRTVEGRQSHWFTLANTRDVNDRDISADADAEYDEKLEDRLHMDLLLLQFCVELMQEMPELSKESSLLSWHLLTVRFNNTQS